MVGFNRHWLSDSGVTGSGWISPPFPHLVTPDSDKPSKDVHRRKMQTIDFVLTF